MNTTYAAVEARPLLTETRRVLQRVAGASICLTGAAIYAVQLAALVGAGAG